MLTLALSLAAAGTPVFPCRPENKRPFTSNGFKSASVFPHVLDRWWRDWPDALVGMPTGERTGVWVLDMDSHKGAAESDLPYSLPPTRMVRTRSGGKHFYFRHAGLGCSPGRLPAGWDVRSTGGYVLVPGNPGYTLEHDLPPADAAEWLLAMIRPKPYTPRPSTPYQPQGHDHYVRSAITSELAELARCPAGSRGYQLNTAAFRLGTLVGAGALDRSEAEHGLLDAAHGCGLVAVDGERAVRATIRRGLDAGSRQPRALPERDNTPLVDVSKLLRKRRA
ncbi:bifunctional DNA primase/polymerase [Bradyrhizobium japonicum]|uniref:bifunctional DNA primase/polymerase n=1 Tax=Bradyrhizobium japonicum TaxID=375 RepID=UPI00068D5C68|nr:bifunctional DNA primase/polymerase [Bradyrhizobium japonicum]MCD9109930.1 bifunctional DNA primase/polymerase [Bradyrhizobium japonicum]MCD9256664.1 bifunctional DNA primase/polymerase [Bradyrhizobium japonicum SEMIA 5079]MCD9910392.1 bifunctional DNA primase/polymerase [Bradyrhizobium japonicum]MCS3977509.1 putative DNA primase/helicase [Bradyrhizobium japonicum]WRI75758.1 bifunctional DNA primase/polymerase [Bradyrhizobium japonicum]